MGSKSSEEVGEDIRHVWTGLGCTGIKKDFVNSLVCPVEEDFYTRGAKCVLEHLWWESCCDVNSPSCAR